MAVVSTVGGTLEVPEFTEDEREEEFYNYQKNLIDDMGLESFTEWAQDYIIDNFVNDEWFTDAMVEYYGDYILGLNEELADDEEFENRLEEEMAEVGCKDEEEFLNKLDELSKQAFDDQCTGANPRYPLIEEIKQMYLRAYYGGEV